MLLTADQIRQRVAAELDSRLKNGLDIPGVVLDIDTWCPFQCDRYNLLTDMMQELADGLFYFNGGLHMYWPIKALVVTDAI